KPNNASCCRITARIGSSPTGMRGLGSTALYGRRRLPFPPASTTARLDIVQIAFIPPQISFVAEPFACALQAFRHRNTRLESGGFAQFAIVAIEAQDFAIFRAQARGVG